jgi:hypothetical protein
MIPFNERSMRSRASGPGGAFMLAVLLSLTACDRSSAPTDPMLPPGFAERSDRPYIAGSIVERSDANGEVRLLVRAPRGATLGVPEARVTVGARALMKWTDGRVASPRELRVGRRVTVWVTGPELQSLPPQVTASALLIAR